MIEDLTPEERRRIYLEEQARIEIRREIQGKRTASAGKVVGIILLCALGLVIVMLIFGANLERQEHAAFQQLTPAQQEQAAWRACIEFLNSPDIRFKTYSELSLDERRMKVSCTGR
jgi:hypothetical protein